MIPRTPTSNLCIRCHRKPTSCRCDAVEALATRTRLVLLMHGRESRRHLYRGAFALRALENSQLYLHGERDAPLDLSCETTSERRLLVLSKDPEAPVLDSKLIAQDRRPITLVASEGSTRTKNRIAKRVPGLDGAQFVRLPEEDEAKCLNTFDHLSRALGIIEGEALESRLQLAAAQVFVKGPSNTPPEAARLSVAAGPLIPEALTLLYQDEHLVAACKPSGVVTHRGWGRQDNPLLQQLRDQIGRFVHPLHRLDRATSGVVLFALDAETARRMHAQFEARTIKKEYLALCRGHTLCSQVLDHPLKVKGQDVVQSAVTGFELLGHSERYGLVRAIPHTGRTHQIRRHLKHLAHPIIGDVRYGSGEHNRLFRERFDFHRLALHAQRLSFIHPHSKKPCCILAPLDKQWTTLLEQLSLLDQTI